MLRLDPVAGVIEGVRYVPSPNCDVRPDPVSIDVLVIHAISLPPNEFGGRGIEQLFTNTLAPDEHPYYQQIAGLRVSSHLLVRRTGEAVQFVPLQLRAWHAGESFCEGRKRVNDFSIGIELEGSDDVPFEEPQYQTLAQLTKLILTQFPSITMDRIYGHSDIAPGRKTDPGPFFSWERYRRLYESLTDDA